MLVRGSRHKCCGPPTPCVELDEFTGYFWTAWDEVDDPSGSTPLTLDWDRDNERMGIDGQGSVTHRVTSNPDVIHVAAEIQSLVSGSAGVTIRRVDSSDNISLWWMGGTSYELRQGSTVLESIVGSGSGKIKVELATPSDPTTDILVYIDDTLVHTEAGVAFVMPDVLHLGMIVDGEAVFEWVEWSPCMISRCEPYLPVECGTSARPTNLPKFWFAHIPYPSDRNFVDCATSFGQIVYEEDVYFQSGSDETRPVSYFSEGEWREWGSPCSYQPITISRTVYGVDTDLYPLPEGAYPVEYWGGCTLADELMPHSNNAGNSSNIGFGKWNLTLEFRITGTEPSLVHEYRISVGMSYNSGSPYIQYRTGWTVFDPDVELGTIVIPLYENNTTFTGWQPTISLEPNGASKEIAKELMGCGDGLCTPPVTPQPGQCYIVDITMTDENGSPWRWVTPTGASFNEDTGSWEWTGSGIGYTNYVHDTCGSLPQFDVKIHCVELEEGAEKQWVMDIITNDGTSRLTFEWFNEPGGIPGWTGTTDLMCTGETWDVYAIGPNITSDSDYTFGSCSWNACTTPNGLVFGGTIDVSCYNNISDPPLTANGYLLFTPTDDLPVGVSPGSVNGMVFRAPLPNHLTGGGASIVFLFVQSGSAMVYIVDSDLELVADMFATIGYSCDPSDGKASLDGTSPIPYYWGSPNPQLTDPFGLCNAGDGNGDWDITFW